MSHDVARRLWSGVTVEVNEWHGAGRVLHAFPDTPKTRLVALLEEVGSPCEARLDRNKSCTIGYTPRHMDFVPAGTECWGFGADVRFVRDVSLSFDVAALSDKMQTTFDGAALSSPRLRFADDRIWPLAKMLAAAVNDTDPAAQLYGDGLIAAIAAQLFVHPAGRAASSKGLAPWQLRRVVDYLDAHLPDRVELADLAALTGLSPSHFSRAFKEATGMAPYRWQLAERVRRAQAMLIDSPSSLDDVAEATGFADAVHFGRTFRKVTGTTPAAWRRERQR